MHVWCDVCQKLQEIGEMEDGEGEDDDEEEEDSDEDDDDDEEAEDWHTIYMLGPEVVIAIVHDFEVGREILVFAFLIPCPGGSCFDG